MTPRGAAVVLTIALAAVPPCAGAHPTTRYVMHVLRLPAGMALVPNPVSEYGVSGVALGANGAVAAIVNDIGPESASRIVVWRANGSRVTISLPPNDMLRETFRHADPGGPPRRYTAFQRVVLATDGTPLATIGFTFDGAYLGTDTSVFRWTGVGWNHVPSPRTAAASDFTVVAAELTPLRLGVVGTYSSAVWSMDSAWNGGYVEEAWTARGTSWTLLGSGILEAIAGAYACGARSERDGKAFAFGWAPPSAMLWDRGRERRLGAGIAFAVNANGVAVGDNWHAVRGDAGDGVPTRWDAHGVTEFAREPGTAYAIAAGGTIVGSLQSRGGFVVRDGSAVALDRLTSGPHVLGAYAVNDRGRILVETGTREAPGLAYLDPVR